MRLSNFFKYNVILKKQEVENERKESSFFISRKKSASPYLNIRFFVKQEIDLKEILVKIKK